MTDPANIIADRILPLASSGGSVVRSHDPSRPSRVIWNAATIPVHVDQAVNAARAAFPAWSAWPTERRAQALRAYKTLAENRFRELADLLCAETGKAMWEAEAEARLLAAKVDTTLMEGPMNAGSGRARITPFDIPITATRIGRCTFRPHGVMAVLGPFNFPAHLPNGHIVPALLAGNTVVFKPSDKTPAVGQLLAGLFVEALASVGAPRGVVNLVQGGADIATRLVSHEGIDGILFTGSWPVGRRILEANIDRPGR
ncbi:MAG: aldehyde dehydrogenase family protein, partial [Phycisphaerae bacterium]|nr:aldehyde dehydrogenase family protein [Phycisphaerae bacterium]